MRKSLYIALLGLIFMMTGIVTTYVAFGQTNEGEASSEDPVEATVTMTPTMTPIIEQQVILPTTAVEHVQPILPTIIVVPTEIPASPIPTEAPIEPTVEISPTQVIVEATPTEIIIEATPVTEPTLAPTEMLMGAASVENSDATPTVDVVETVVEAAPTEMLVEEPTLLPTETVIEGSEPTLTVETPIEETPLMEPTATIEVLIEETVVPVEPTVVEAISAQANTLDEAAAIAPPDATPQIPVAEDPLFTPTAGVEQQPVTSELTVTPESEMPSEGFVTMVPTDALITPTVETVDAATLEAVATLSLVSGQVSMSHRAGTIHLLLTLPDGTTQESSTDEAGSFVFEELLPGDYGLVASAPGFLSKAVTFSLVEGEELALPVAALSAGDLNQDDQIDLSDVVLIAANYNGPAVITEADLNGDEWIDISDLTIIGARFGLSGPTAWE